MLRIRMGVLPGFGTSLVLSFILFISVAWGQSPSNQRRANGLMEAFTTPQGDVVFMRRTDHNGKLVETFSIQRLDGQTSYQWATGGKVLTLIDIHQENGERVWIAMDSRTKIVLRTAGGDLCAGRLGTARLTWSEGGRRVEAVQIDFDHMTKSDWVKVKEIGLRMKQSALWSMVETLGTFLKQADDVRPDLQVLRQLVPESLGIFALAHFNETRDVHTEVLKMVRSKKCPGVPMAKGLEPVRRQGRPVMLACARPASYPVLWDAQPFSGHRLPVGCTTDCWRSYWSSGTTGAEIAACLIALRFGQPWVIAG